MRRIAILGEIDPDFEPHSTITVAIEHACQALGVDVEAKWVLTKEISEALLDQFQGIWISPGGPYEDVDKVFWAIRTAREGGVPCLATCGGFQHMVVEYARNVLGFKDAQHAEYDPGAPVLFISRLERSMAGRSMELRFVPGSRISRIYGSQTAIEHYYCNYGVNPAYTDELKQGPIHITGSDEEGEVRVMELPGHPFFLGTLFVPQVRSTPWNPHPVITEFVRAVVG